MLVDQFRQWSQLMTDAVLLLEPQGRIVAGNHALASLDLDANLLIDKNLAHLATSPHHSIDALLSLYRRAEQPHNHLLQLTVKPNSTQTFQCHGMRYQPSSNGDSAFILLRLTLDETTDPSPQNVDQQIQSLHQEIRRRTQLEERLHRQNNFLRVTLTSIGDGVIVTDANGVITMLNPVAELLTGWPTDSAVGQNLSDVFQTIDVQNRQPVENAGLRALQKGDSSSSQLSNRLLVSRDGAERPIHDSAAPILGSDNKLFGAVLVFRDITEQKNAEQTLSEQKNLLQTVTDNLPSMLFMTDTEGNITFVNRAVKTLTGYSPHELMGKSLVEILRPALEDKPVALTDSSDALSILDYPQPLNKTIQGRDDFLYRANGEWFPVRCSASPIMRSKQVIGTVLEIQDITAERAAREALAQSEARFSQLADAIPQLAWTARGDGYIDWFNNRWYEYTGTTLEESQGWGWQQSHDPDVLPKVLENWNESINTGKPFSMVFPLKGKDGTFRPFLTRIMPFLNEGGTVIRWFGTNTDISEQKQLEEELRLIAARLSEADRKKDEFLATLAHELRNPLAPIRTGLEVMKLAKDDPQAVEEVRQTMERQAKQLVTLIDDLMDVSRITRGKFELRFENTLLQDVVQSAVEAVKPFIDEQGHQLHIDQPKQPIHLWADPNRLAQVLSNLLNNAAKYTIDPGTIWLTVITKQGNVSITVKDTGCGIPRDMQDSIFDMFTQVDRSLEKGQSGLGIGLTLVRSLVTMHKGQIVVSSQGADQGTQFTVTLPMTRPHDQPAIHRPNKAHSTRSRKVLVVDDNVAAANSLRTMLTFLGHDVRTANDGLEGINVAEAYRPEVVLLDLGMPKLNGFEAARQLRERDWAQHVTLVAVTGWGQEKDRVQTQKAGFDYHLVKPVEPDVLQTILQDPARP